MELKGLSDSGDWHTAGNVWLQKVVEGMFYSWKTTKSGKKYRGKGSPYDMGFALPSWVDDAIDALNKADEERFKAIKRVQSLYLWRRGGDGT